jgi:hypothetical protein
VSNRRAWDAVGPERGPRVLRSAHGQTWNFEMSARTRGDDLLGPGLRRHGRFEAELSLFGSATAASLAAAVGRGGYTWGGTLRRVAHRSRVPVRVVSVEQPILHDYSPRLWNPTMAPPVDPKLTRRAAELVGLGLSVRAATAPHRAARHVLSVALSAERDAPDQAKGGCCFRASNCRQTASKSCSRDHPQTTEQSRNASTPSCQTAQTAHRQAENAQSRQAAPTSSSSELATG